jgi:hypothetical protein
MVVAEFHALLNNGYFDICICEDIKGATEAAPSLLVYSPSTLPDSVMIYGYNG